MDRLTREARQEAALRRAQDKKTEGLKSESKSPRVEGSKKKAGHETARKGVEESKEIITKARNEENTKLIYS